MFGARVGAGKYSYSVNPFAVPGEDVFAFRMALTVADATGKSQVALVSDLSWLETDSPIVWENLYNGEVYDARLEQDNWASLDFDTKCESSQTADESSGCQAWRPVKEVALPAGAHAVLSSRLFPPIRVGRFAIASIPV